MQNNVYQAVIKPGFGKPSKYLKRKRKARDVSVGSEDDRAGISKRVRLQHVFHAFKLFEFIIVHSHFIFFLMCVEAGFS